MATTLACIFRILPAYSPGLAPSVPVPNTRKTPKMKKSTSDLMAQLPKEGGRRQGLKKGSSPTAEQIAASMETEARRMLDLAKILRGQKA